MSSVNPTNFVVDAIIIGEPDYDAIVDAIVVGEPVYDELDIRFEIFQKARIVLMRREYCLMEVAILSLERLAASPSSIDAFIDAIEYNANLNIDGVHWTEIIIQSDYVSLMKVAERLVEEHTYLDDLQPSLDVLTNRRVFNNFDFDVEVVEIVQTLLSYKISCLNKFISIVEAVEMNIDNLKVFGQLIAKYDSYLMLPTKLSENDEFIQQERLIGMMEHYMQVETMLAKILSNILDSN
jgi:hypothetical protein